MQNRLRAAASLVAFQLSLGCAAAAATSSDTAATAATAAPAPAPSASALPAQQPSAPEGRHPALQRAVQAVVDQAQFPTAAAVLSVNHGKLLALGEPEGQRLATAPLRPGSTLKPLLALVALEHQLLSPGEQTPCKGQYERIAGFSCFDRHGPLSLTRALTVSCNTYFYALAERVGLERISAGFSKLGLAAPTGLVAEEPTAQLPDRHWLERHAPERPSDWPGWSALIGTGHGPIKVTLLQLAVAYTRLLHRLPELRASAVPAQASVAGELERGLRAVVSDAAGTGHAAQVSGLSVAGKTGTAEGCAVHQADCAEPENGWFVGFAPADDPQVLVAVLARGGQSGSTSAAPIARRIFEAWHGLGRPRAPGD